MLPTVSAVLAKIAVSLGLLTHALAAQPVNVSPNFSEQKVPHEEVIKISPVWDALDKLALCESTGKRSVKILDANGKLSYGTFQFQEGTFHRYGEKYGLPHDDIMNRGQQTAIAKRMLEEGLWTHWKNCGLKVGLDKLFLEGPEGLY